jgi:hypothetical protein
VSCFGKNDVFWVGETEAIATERSSNGGGKVWVEKIREVVVGGILRDPSLRSG